MSNYKYLGATLTEYLDFNVTANILVGVAVGHRENIIEKLKKSWKCGNVEILEMCRLQDYLNLQKLITRACYGHMPVDADTAVL